MTDLPLPWNTPARNMSANQLCAQYAAVSAKWDTFIDNEHECSGSPGEWMFELLDELRTEAKRRNIGLPGGYEP